MKLTHIMASMAAASMASNTLHGRLVTPPAVVVVGRFASLFSACAMLAGTPFSHTHLCGRRGRERQKLRATQPGITPSSMANNATAARPSSCASSRAIPRCTSTAARCSPQPSRRLGAAGRSTRGGGAG
ncbi:hypothetical protein CFC21_091747 [Triticum aestivum]|uniref:Uncharacterized protein n=4 Tax=Triticinae TaxID=1648030 RepID=A0A453NAM2_AEGTS|nr:hypothetical protein CFC21_091747 [Triticum aestivum]